MSAKPRRKSLIAARPNGLSFPWVHKGRWALIVKTAFRWCHHRWKTRVPLALVTAWSARWHLNWRNASLEEMVRFGVAAGSAATSTREHACAPMTIRKKFTRTFPANKTFPSIGESPPTCRQRVSPTMLKSHVDNKGVNYGQWRSCPLCNNRHVAWGYIDWN